MGEQLLDPARDIDRIFAGLAEVVRAFRVDVDPVIDPPVSGWEAEWFLAGLRLNRFGFSVPAASGHPTAAYFGAYLDKRAGGMAANLFQTPHAGRRTVAREQVTTMAALSKADRPVALSQEVDSA